MTLPGRLVERASREPGRTAARSKRLGLYVERTWRDWAAAAGERALALSALGVARGDCIALLGDAREELVLYELAAQALGAVTCSLYPTARRHEIERRLAACGAALVIAENQHLLDLALVAAERLPALHTVLTLEAGLRDGTHPKLRELPPLSATVAEPDRAIEALARFAASLDPDAPAFIAQSAGTTGEPHGAAITHGVHLAAMAGVAAHFLLLHAPQTTVAHIPLAHPLGRAAAIGLPLVSELVPHFGEGDDDLQTTLLEVEPSVLFTMPRLLHRLAARVATGIAETSPLKRKVHDMALAAGRTRAARRWEGRAKPLTDAAAAVLAMIAFQPIRATLGLGRIELLVCGGAPLAPEVLATWQVYGVNAVEAYVLAEAAGGIVSSQRGRYSRPGDAGSALAGVRVRLDENGEVIVESEGQAVSSGDIGAWDGDRLRIAGRLSHLLVGAAGVRINPHRIEARLRACPYIAEAIVVAGERGALLALVELDFEIVARWAARHRAAYAGLPALASRPDVVALVGAALEAANREVPAPEQVPAFRILPRPLDTEAEDDPITPTRQVRRQRAAPLFRDLVESADFRAKEGDHAEAADGRARGERHLGLAILGAG
jgi:long-chain acyl-CoA synthetase